MATWPQYHPHPPVVDMGAQECASMSRQHCRMALAPSMMLPGHGSTFLCLPHRRQTHIRSPYTPPPTPPTQRHGKCPIMQRCRNHPSGSCPLGLPVAMGWSATNRGGALAPPASGITPRNTKMKLASSGSTSVLPGNVGDDWVHICTRSQLRQPPGSPLRLPGVSQAAR